MGMSSLARRWQHWWPQVPKIRSVKPLRPSMLTELVYFHLIKFVHSPCRQRAAGWGPRRWRRPCTRLRGSAWRRSSRRRPPSAWSSPSAWWRLWRPSEKRYTECIYKWREGSKAGQRQRMPRKFLLLFSKPLLEFPKNGQWRIHPISKLDGTKGFGCLGHSNWTICRPLSPFCFRRISNFSLSYWEANSYYPRGLIWRKGNYPNPKIG